MYIGVLLRMFSDGVQSVPHTTPIRDNVNPATWMLEVIGAGTSGKVITILFGKLHRVMGDG